MNSDNLKFNEMYHCTGGVAKGDLLVFQEKYYHTKKKCEVYRFFSRDLETMLDFTQNELDGMTLDT